MLEICLELLIDLHLLLIVFNTDVELAANKKQDEEQKRKGHTGASKQNTVTVENDTHSSLQELTL